MGGMVLIELLTARMPAVPREDGNGFTFLLAAVRPGTDQANDRLLTMVDTSADWPDETAASLATFALLCIHSDAQRRPSFVEVAAALQNFLQVDDGDSQDEHDSVSLQRAQASANRSARES